MQFPIGKIISLLIAIAYVSIAAMSRNGALVWKACVGLILPLALIWFPEQLGSFTGWYSHGCEVKNETPAILVSIFGWFFLIGLPLIVFLLS